MKTGTPPRIDKRSINFKILTEQAGDQPVPVFSFLGNEKQHPQQIPCYITHTNEETHNIIRTGLDRSPLYTGVIEGIGPRYCPSIEDKIMRFADKNSHQIFVEPEGLTSNEIYPNGISTSLPFDIQLRLVRSMKGFENAHITRPGYAIEYDFFDPRDLKPSLETKAISGLFFAGQINGTTGYEEAAAQGLLAGLNAGLFVQEKSSWTPLRNEAYLGVLVDDLITLGTNEPYRMFTSRAEYRLLLREDNADLRLTEMGRNLGLIDEQRWAIFNEKREAIEIEKNRLKSLWALPNDETIESILGQPLRKENTYLDLLRRPEMNYELLKQLPQMDQSVSDPQVIEQIETQIKYSGYIERQQVEITRQRRYEETQVPDGFDYNQVKGLSAEVCQKLNRHRPVSIGQASRISGVTPAAISLLLVYLKKYREQKD